MSTFLGPAWRYLFLPVMAIILFLVVSCAPLFANHPARFPVRGNGPRTIVRAPGVRVDVGRIRGIQGTTSHVGRHISRNRVIYRNLDYVSRGVYGYAAGVSTYVAPPPVVTGGDDGTIDYGSAPSYPEQINSPPMEIGTGCAPGGCATDNGDTIVEAPVTRRYIPVPRAPAPSYGTCCGCTGGIPMTYTAPQRTVVVYREVVRTPAPCSEASYAHSYGYASYAPSYGYLPSYGIGYSPGYAYRAYGTGYSRFLNVGYATRYLSNVWFRHFHRRH